MPDDLSAPSPSHSAEKLNREARRRSSSGSRIVLLRASFPSHSGRQWTCKRGFRAHGVPGQTWEPRGAPSPENRGARPDTRDLLAAKRDSCGQGPALGSELPVTAAHPRGTCTLFQPRSESSFLSALLWGGLPDRGVPPTWPIARDVTPGPPGGQAQIRSRVAERERERERERNGGRGDTH